MVVRNRAALDFNAYRRRRFTNYFGSGRIAPNIFQVAQIAPPDEAGITLHMGVSDTDAQPGHIEGLVDEVIVTVAELFLACWQRGVRCPWVRVQLLRRTEEVTLIEVSSQDLSGAFGELGLYGSEVSIPRPGGGGELRRALEIPRLQFGIVEDAPPCPPPAIMTRRDLADPEVRATLDQHALDVEVNLARSAAVFQAVRKVVEHTPLYHHPDGGCTGCAREAWPVLHLRRRPKVRALQLCPSCERSDQTHRNAERKRKSRQATGGCHT